MRAEFVVVCDFASGGNKDGKLTLVGTFDLLNTPAVPFTVPSIGIGIKLRWENTDAPNVQHPMDIRIKTPSGDILGRLEAAVAASAPGPGQQMEMLSTQVALNMQNTVFPKFGKYAVELWIDKRLATTLPIFVVKV